MAYDELKAIVLEANLEIVKAGLVELTWGNASGVDRAAGVMAIKPSGVSYESMRADDMVVVSLDSGAVVEGRLKPSSDTATHLILYQRFPEIGGIVHTHSSHAVSWAQAERSIPCFGTTHADHFYGPVPVTRRMRDDEIMDDYERNTGLVIVECFTRDKIKPTEVPGVLVACHGPFAWGQNPPKAVQNAIVLESTARMAMNTLAINTDAKEIDQALLDKHYLRKHGSTAYYGQDEA